MKPTAYLPALAATALLLATPVAQAQAEQTLVVRLAATPYIDPSNLQDGRIVPGAPVEVHYKHLVATPPLTVCPFAAITLHYTLDPLPEWATGSLSMSSQSFYTDVTKLTAAADYGPFENGVTIVTGPDAPHGAPFVVTLVAQASPNGGTTSGCNLKSSQDLAASVVLVTQ